jgi:hypothetical protein
MFVAFTCSDLEASIAIILLFYVVECSSGLSEIVCVGLMCSIWNHLLSSYCSVMHAQMCNFPLIKLGDLECY